ncbi:flagellar motor switch protein FliG [Thalassoroseus pseudoceratinae]|uniref:flagellar motor switch protein FliG n=1 Tax=Thalassoroseus pseudoceratinae TaxID=2713176 RepID=UPI0014239162|nr:flagellar motor switch protein FliG [Thalassoroseus pseudoceratinae]
MSEVRKAAVLLLSLDKQLAASVLGQVRKDLVEKLMLEIARLNDVPEEEQDRVIEEFSTSAKVRSHIERGGIDFADQLLRESLGEDGADAILDNVRQSLSSVPFGFLQKVGADNLITFIQEEHPQTIALIMSHLPPGLAAEVLSGLPSSKQLEVIRRVASMEQTNPEVVEDVERTLRKRMQSSFSQQLEKAGGVPMVAQILNVTDRMTNKAILETLEDDDSELVDEIKRLMFVFDDLLKLDDKAIQVLLKEVDSKQWSFALKGASQEIRDRVLGNLSQRAAELLKEEMEYLGPVKVSDVEANQQEIVDTVRRLEESGEIEVSGGAEGDQYIS